MEPILEVSGASDEQIMALFSEYSVALTPDEGRQIVQMLGRNPTLTEATVWGIQGSEHSSYKSSREYLKKLPTKGEHVLMGPGEDSGILHFHTSKKTGEIYGLVVAHESHNHPSQVVPFEGAATGVGGISRDISCMGARVIGALDALRFGDINEKETKRIMNGVVAGVGGYGNPLGVPNLGGDALFDDSFNENCLVNVVALGMIKWKNILHSYVPKNAAEDGYKYILVGKPTDRSGFGGSSFASALLNEDDKEKNKGAIQEPNPFLERHLFASFDDLFKRLEERGDLHRIALKDLGAGGVLCATVELVAEQGFGADIDVEKIHTAEKKLPAAVILCAETQERFCFAVPPELTDFVLEHFNKRWDFPNVSHGAWASKIGKVTANGVYTATYQGEKVCDAKALDITEGIQVHRPIEAPKKIEMKNPDWTAMDAYELFLNITQSENVCSTKPFSETYDQTVQGNTVLTRDETEAVSFTPLRDYDDLPEDEQKIYAVVSVAGPNRVGRVCPKTQSEMAMAQAVLKNACAGGKTLGLTDCLNYGNPEMPKQMWEFSEGIDGLKHAAEKMNTPFVSGNVSLYNCSHTTSVSPSAIIGAMGKIPLGHSPRKNAFQKAGNVAVLLGERSGNLGGSEALRLYNNSTDAPVPTVNFDEVNTIVDILTSGDFSFDSAALISTGGLAGTVFRMMARGKIGGNLSSELGHQQWYCETPGVVVECSLQEAEKLISFATEKGIFAETIVHLGGDKLVVGGADVLTVNEMANRYWNTLRIKR